MRRTRSHAAAAALTLAALPDDAFLHVIDACAYEFTDDPLLFEDVKGLVCNKALRQQFHRLRPLVGVLSLAVVQRPTQGPWHLVLLYEGSLTAAVLKQARKGRVRSINASECTLAPAMARRVVPELLGAGCSLRELDLCLTSMFNTSNMFNTWAAIFGEASVCSVVLSTLLLGLCDLRGPLPELRLPALQRLDLMDNQLTGGLEPLCNCTALQILDLSNNQLTGSLEPLRGCTALQHIGLALSRDMEEEMAGGYSKERNRFTGSLEPLRGCTVLQELTLAHSELTGGLDPLRNCTALEALDLRDNQLTGGLEPLQGCTALKDLSLDSNALTGGLEPLRGCKVIQSTGLYDNQLTGDLEPLWGCTKLQLLEVKNNQLVITDEDTSHFKDVRVC